MSESAANRADGNPKAPVSDLFHRLDGGEGLLAALASADGTIRDDASLADIEAACDSDLASMAPSQLIQWHLRGRHAHLRVVFDRMLRLLADAPWPVVDCDRNPYEVETCFRRLDQWLQAFLFIIAQDEFRVGPGEIESLLSWRKAICDLVAVSSFRHATPWLEHAAQTTDAGVKMLLLSTPRCHDRPDVGYLARHQGNLATRWFYTYGHVMDSLADKLAWTNVSEQLVSLPGATGYHDFEGMAKTYVMAAFASWEGSAPLRRDYHERLRQIVQRAPIRNRPDPASLAIIAGTWSAESRAKRYYGPLVEQLSRKYRLTLIHAANEDKEPPMADQFHAIHSTRAQGRSLQLAPILENDFQLVFFADGGMDPTTQLLANARIAPLQLGGLAALLPVEGTAMDLVLEGSHARAIDVDQAAATPRPVAVARLGLSHLADIEPASIERASLGGPEPARILIASAPERITYPLLHLLDRVAQQCRREVEFVFLALEDGSPPIVAEQDPAEAACSGGAHLPLARAVLTRDIQQTLGPAARVVWSAVDVPPIDLAVDPWPVGDVDVTASLLKAGIPVAAREDGAARQSVVGLLHLAGLPELVARGVPSLARAICGQLTEGPVAEQTRARLDAVAGTLPERCGTSVSELAIAIDHLATAAPRLAREADPRAVFAG